MIQVPEEFIVPEKHIYPPGNIPSFEGWFMHQNLGAVNEREYIGILWTAFYKNHSYGKDQSAIDRLQGWLNQLPTDKKYFAVVQYDDGILNDISHLDCVVFSMSGKPGNSIPIPLVCHPHKFEFPGIEKDILFSFVGRITDPMRQTIVDWGRGKKDCYITSAPHPLEAYCKILARSRFVLCCRGYGSSSFRVGESLQYNATPVLYTRKEDVVFEDGLIFPICKFGQLEWSDLDFMEHFLRTTYKPGLVSNKWIYDSYYTFDGLKAYIIEKLKEC